MWGLAICYLNKMAMYKYLNKLLKNKKSLKSVIKDRLIEWRKQPSQIKIKKPTNLVTARSLGYKAKKGYNIIRIKIKRGGRQRPQFKKGRRPTHYGRRLVLKKSYQWVAEERVSRKYKNLQVLNSYLAGKDGLHYWFEVILVNPNEPSIKKDPKINWILNQKGRTFRGKTSAGRKSRGLKGKGKGYEKVRPSLRAHKSRGK